MAAALLEAALGNLLAVAVLAAAALAVDRFARRPALSHALWLIVLVKLVTPPVVSVPVRCLPPGRVLPGGLAPLVWAVGRPTLFFPVGLTEFLSPRQRTVLIAHELAHLKRWDHLVRWLEFAVLALYWWCPLAWWARDGLRRAE